MGLENMELGHLTDESDNLPNIDEKNIYHKIRHDIEEYISEYLKDNDMQNNRLTHQNNIISNCNIIASKYSNNIRILANIRYDGHNNVHMTFRITTDDHVFRMIKEI